MNEAVLFLFRAIADLFLMVVLLRLFLQMFRANFRNPIAQAVLKLTSPLVIPLRRVLPPVRSIDTATLVLAIGLEILFVLVIGWLHGSSLSLPAIVLYGVLRTILISLRLFFFAILIYIVLSWIASQSYNPISALLGAISEPLLAPARRVIPPIAGLDLSPIAVLLLLQATIIVVSQWLPFGLR